MKRWFRPFMLCAALVLSQQAAHATDIYGYIDSKGNAHFASEKLDERYQIFFRGGQSFDTANGIAPLGRGVGKLDGKVPPASQSLLAMFEASPSYKTAKSALRDAASKHAIDYELLQALVATESGFDAQAVSPKGAMGLMQLMPATAQRYGVLDAFNAEQNLRGGLLQVACHPFAMLQALGLLKQCGGILRAGSVGQQAGRHDGKEIGRAHV